MGECKDNSKMSKMLIMALLPVIFLAGCHGNFGWDRVRVPIGFQNQGGLDQSQQVEVVPEDAGRPAEYDA